jgi:hypothetical protein
MLHKRPTPAEIPACIALHKYRSRRTSFRCVLYVVYLGEYLWPRPDGRRGGGLAVLFRTNLPVVKVNSNIKPTSFELLIIAVGKDANRFLVVTIYRPPDTNMNTFVKCSHLKITGLGSMNQHLILMWRRYHVEMIAKCFIWVSQPVRQLVERLLS